MVGVTDAQIAAYDDTIRALARPLVGRNSAELDDLVQEGRISVWQALANGITPSKTVIYGRLLNYVKWLGRQTPIPYEVMLPIEDYTEAAIPDAAEILG